MTHLLLPDTEFYSFFVYVHEKISEKHGKNNNVETAESGCNP